MSQRSHMAHDVQRLAAHIQALEAHWQQQRPDVAAALGYARRSVLNCTLPAASPVGSPDIRDDAFVPSALQTLPATQASQLGSSPNTQAIDGMDRTVSFYCQVP